MVVLTLLACLLAVIAVDRACFGAAARADRPPAEAAARLPAPTATPTPLSSGACQALAPTGKSRGRTVFLDPGHGGADPGVTGVTPSGAVVRESAVALAVAGELAGRLRADGYRVVLSRTADTSVVHIPRDQLGSGGMSAEQVHQDLLARVRCANDAHAAVLLSIHFNGYADPSVGGSQTVYDTARSFAAENERLGRGLQAAMTSRLQRADRGLVADDDLVVPTLSDRASVYGHLLLLGPAEPGWLAQPSGMPGALVEPLFLTNSAEAALASSADSRRSIAAALAAGLETYLSTPPPTG